MAQAPRPPSPQAPQASSPPPARPAPQGPPSGRTAQSYPQQEEYPRSGPPDRPEAGQPGSQRLSPQAGAGTDIGPVPERPGMLRPQAQDKQSIFENMPGQQIPGMPAHPGHEEDRQHLRGRTIADGSAVEDEEPKPVGVRTRAIMPGRMGTEEPDAPDLPVFEEEEAETQTQRPAYRSPQER